MKKILLLTLTAVIMGGCETPHGYQVVPETKHLEYEGWGVVEMDSCEYIGTLYSNMRGMFAHKGNCRFCAERRKQELQRIVEQLKDSKYD